LVVAERLLIINRTDTGQGHHRIPVIAARQFSLAV
jgi:hypothetical protein